MFLTRKRQGWSEFNLKFSRKSSHLDSLLFFSDGILQVFWIGIFLHSQQRKSIFQLGFSKATSCVLKKTRCMYTFTGFTIHRTCTLTSEQSSICWELREPKIVYSGIFVDLAIHIDSWKVRKYLVYNLKIRSI